MNAIKMHQVLNFIYNKNIDIIEDIFKDKVPRNMMVHLIDKKELYKECNNNLKAWVEFIGNLDNTNSEIIFEYMTTKK